MTSLNSFLLSAPHLLPLPNDKNPLLSSSPSSSPTLPFAARASAAADYNATIPPPCCNNGKQSSSVPLTYREDPTTTMAWVHLIQAFTPRSTDLPDNDEGCHRCHHPWTSPQQDCCHPCPRPNPHDTSSSNKLSTIMPSSLSFFNLSADVAYTTSTSTSSLFPRC
jgi:hypothetical protein